MSASGYRKAGAAGSGAATVDLTAINAAIAALTATQARFLTDWYAAESDFLMGLNVGLTQCRPWKPGSLLRGTQTFADVTGADDAGVPGGGIKGAAGNYTLLGASLFPNWVTGTGAISFRGQLGGGGASGHDTWLGLSNNNGSQLWGATRRSGGIGGPTKWNITTLNGGTFNEASSGSNADGNIHTYSVVKTPTACKLYVEHTLEATLSAFGSAADGVLFAMIYAQTAREVLLTDLLWAW